MPCSTQHMSGYARSVNEVLQMRPVGWFRWGVATILETGVSNWPDQSGNGNDLVQATADAQPALLANSDIDFDGSDDTLKAVAFAFVQPCSYYLLMSQNTWTVNELVCDGNTATLRIFQRATTPNLALTGGAVLGNIAPVLGAMGVVATVANSSSSSIRLDLGTPVSGDTSTADPGGFSLAANSGGTATADMTVREVILFPAAHTAADQEILIKGLALRGRHQL